MLNFPEFPDTLSTRQIQCICCNEVFTVSEDYPTVTGGRTESWRLVPDRSSDTRLRYQPVRRRRDVTPPMRAESDRDLDEFLNWEQSSGTLVNCPRCGADNRNWLHIFRSPQSWRFWLQQLRPALFGYLATLILCAMALIRAMDAGEKTSNLILLVVSIFLVAHIPIQSSTRGWRKLREYHFARPHVRPRSFWQGLPPPLRSGIIATGAFLFLIPFLLYILIPWGFDTAVNILDTNSQQNSVSELKAIVNTLNALPDDLPGDGEKAQAAISELEQFVQTTIANNTSSESPKWMSVSKAFLETWAKFVLAAGIVGIALGWVAAAGYERRIRHHLPRPIFHSIANMTRVVVWEAKRSLEIGDEVQHIQWTAVNRNIQGGINLVGIFRNHGPYRDNDPLTGRVLAQRYKIVSDRWGHIVEADIQPTRVLQQPRIPQQQDEALEVDFFSAAAEQREVKRQ